MTATSFNPDDLLKHATFVRTLARSLISDEHRAEDVEQQAWLTMLDKRPAAGRGLRPWFATVVSRLANRIARSEVRRMRRERLAAAQEAIQYDDSLEHLELTQRLVSEVKALQEPYRGVVLLRFFHELSVREIAHREQVPIATVKTRLRRALADLREGLDRKCGGREAWALALAPLAMRTSSVLGKGVAITLGVAALITVITAMTWDGHGRSSVPAVPFDRPAQVSHTTELPARTPVASNDEHHIAREPVVGADLVDIQGSVVVTDRLGREYREESGSFVLERWRRDSSTNAGWTSAERFDVQVESGHWTARIARGERVGVHLVVLGGQPAWPIMDASWPGCRVSEDGRVVLHASWPAPTVLRVLDADTGADLRGVELRLNGGRGLLPAAESSSLLDEATSPISLVVPRTKWDFEWQVTLWAHVDNYAWQPIAVHFGFGGEHTIRLAHAASLAITLVNYRPAQHTGKLEVAAIGSSPGEYFELEPRDAGPVSVDAIPPGSYRVWFEHTDSRERLVDLGSAFVDLEAGQTTEVTLTLSKPPDDDNVTANLKGRLFLPTAWGDQGITLDVRSQASKLARRLDLTSMQPFPGIPGLHLWDAGQLALGDYEIEIAEFALRQRVALGAEGADVKLVIGEPADVTVRVIDADTGNTVDTDAQLAWNGQYVSGDGAGLYRFRAPVGSIAIKLDDQRWTPVAGYEGLPGNTVAIHAGDNTLTLSVVKSCGIILNLRDSERSLPWPDGVVAVATHIDPVVGGVFHYSCQGTWYRLSVPTRGRYKITVTAIPGCEPVPPFEIEVPPGTFVKHEIELTRKP